MADDLDRIRQNVRKMLDAGAPARDIDAYLATEGYTPERFREANRRGFLDRAFGFLEDAATGVQQGVTLGFADEIGAATAAAVGGIGDILHGRSPDISGRYDKAAEWYRRQYDEAMQRHPIATTAGTIAGGLALPVPAVAGAGSLLGRAAQTAAMGAAYGAAAGFGTGEGGLGNRLHSAGTGALIGAALGGALPAAGAVARGGARLASRLTGLGSPQRRAEDLALRAMERDRVTPEQAAQSLRSTAKPMALADLGTNLTRTARMVQTTPGRGSDMAQDVLTARQIDQGARVLSDIKDTLGDADWYRTFQDLDARRKLEAAPLYEKAFAAGPVYDARVQQFIGDPVIRWGIRRGLKIQRLEALAEGRPFNPSDYAVVGFDEAGDPILGAVPNMRLLDAAKKGLDDIIESARDPLTGRVHWTEELRAIDKVRRAYVAHLDDLNPDYAEARKAWGGPSQSMDALEMGRRFMRGDPEVQQEIYGRLPAADKDYFKLGVVRELEDQINKARDGWDVVLRIFGSKDRRARLRMLFDNPDDFARFESLMRQEARMAQTGRTVLGGSPTARILAEEEDAATAAGHLLMDYLWGGGRYAVLGGVSRALSRIRGIDEPTAEELGRILLTEDPGQRLQIVQRLAERRQAREHLANVLANVMGKSAAALGDTGAQRLLQPAGQ